jgi:urea carboxylase-associated protein 2
MNTFSEEHILFEKIIPGGWNFSHHLKRGTCLRLTDIEGGANASALFFNSDNYAERYNMADTLKAQYTSFLSKGHALYSDMGRILVSIVDDTCGWHDSITSCSNPETNKAKYGEKNYQEYRNAYYRDARTSLITEVSKYGLSIRDLHSLVNFFTKININPEGNLEFVPQTKAGAYIDLQAEMNTLTVLNTCPHPLDINSKYEPKPIKVTVWKANCALEENPCYHSREENKRGFTNTINYFK